MMIACEACQSKYSVADEKVRGKTVRIRCRECQATIVVTGPGASAAPPSVAAYAPQSVAPAAVVKRGGARANRDYVAPVAARAEEPPPAASERPSYGVTAARNENSVLFTLAGLTRRPFVMDAKEQPDAVNSGLIDLNAMRMQAPKPVSNSVMQPLFGSVAPLGPVTMEVEQAPPPAPGRRKLVIGFSVAFAVLAMVAIGFGMSGGSNPPVAAAAIAAPLPVPEAPKPVEPVVAPAAAPTPEAATAIAPGSSSSSASTGKTGKSKIKKSGGGMVKASGPKQMQKAPKAAKAKGGGGDACGCNGELMCMMRCSK